MLQTAVKTLVSSTSLLLVSAVLAEPYVGLELGIGKFDTKGSSSDSTLNDMAQKTADSLDTKVSLRLVGGQYIKDNIRLYLYAQQDGELEVSESSSLYKLTHTYESYELGFGSDYIYNFNNQFSGFLGASLGHYRSELGARIEDSEGYDSETSKKSGLVTGFNLGLGYNVTKNFALQGGWRWSHYAGNKHKIDPITYKLESSNELYFGAGYNF